MDERKTPEQLWRVSQLVDRLEGQLSRTGRLEDDTRQRLIQIRDALLTEAAPAVQSRPTSKK